MKLKLFTIGLLATLAMTGTNVEAAQLKKMQQAQQEAPLLKQQVAAGGPNHPSLDTGTHGDNATAVGDLHAKLGASAANTGVTANHRITDLHTTLGHAIGGAAHGANKRAEDALVALQPLPLGVDVHTAIAHINTILGAVRATASNNGGGIVPPAIVQPNVKTKLDAVLARLKAGLAATALAGVHVHAVATTKTAGTPAGAIVGGDEGNAAAAADIEDFLAEIGW